MPIIVQLHGLRFSKTKVCFGATLFLKLLTSGSGNAAAITKENLDLDFKASESRHRSATRHPVKCRQWKSIVVVSTEPPSIPHQPPDVINASSSSLEFPWPAGLETPSFKIKFAHWFTRGEGKLIKEEYKKLCFLLFFPLFILLPFNGNIGVTCVYSH